MRSGWLLREGDVVCALEMTDSAGERARGLRGRPGCEGALHLPGVRTVHSVAMKFPLDVAFLSDDLLVVRLVRLPPWRVARRRRGARSVLLAESGSWERWRLQAGDQLDIREVR